MTTYLLDDIAKDVRISLDQNMTSGALEEIGDVDTLALNDLIRSKIVEAVKRVHSETPPYLLDGGNNFGDSLHWKDNGSGWVILPDDFMRLVVFEMDDWATPVFDLHTTDEPEYLKQSSRFKGIRGTAQKPICFISIRPVGRVIEFYSSKSEEAQVSRAVYIPYPEVDDYDSIDISERCYDAVVYTIAALVLMTLGDTDKASVLNELAKSALL